MSLPPELYRPVIENVKERKDLYTLLFVSRWVSYEAERCLYHTIDIVVGRTPSLMELFSHLASCPRVANYVRELACWDDIQLENEQAVGQYWHSLNQALRALTHLRVLKHSTCVWFHKHVDPFGPSHILLSNCTFKLEVLSLTDHSTGEFPDIDLTQVKELYLGHKYVQDDEIIDHIIFAPDAFHSLQIMTASHCQFLHLSDHNATQVKALELSDEPSWQFGDIFTHVTSLKLGLDNIMRMAAFPSLRYLHCTIANGTLITFPTPLDDLLEKLKHLEKLCLIIEIPSYQWPPIPMEHPPDFHTFFFSRISTLRELFISYDSLTGELWVRNGTEPAKRPVTYFQDEWKDPQWI